MTAPNGDAARKGTSAPNGTDGPPARNGAVVRNGASQPGVSKRLGSPRSAPVGEERVLDPRQAEHIGPENKRVYVWAPRCRICGHPMRGTVEVTAPAEGPDRDGFSMACHNILCPRCRNDNFIGPATPWLVVSGPLPVR